jgi:hypothetical protein
MGDLHPWTIWHRSRKGIRWKPILSAATEDDAVAQVVVLHLGGDWTVQADGRDPNHRPGKESGAALVAATVRALQAGDSRAVAALRGELERFGLNLGTGTGAATFELRCEEVVQLHDDKPGEQPVDCSSDSPASDHG